MRPQLPKIHKKVRINGHATGRVDIHSHHPATHVRVKLVIPTTRGYSNKKPEYLVCQEEGMDEAFRVVFDVAGER
jgi:hypothetical protein